MFSHMFPPLPSPPSLFSVLFIFPHHINIFFYPCLLKDLLPLMNARRQKLPRASSATASSSLSPSVTTGEEDGAATLSHNTGESASLTESGTPQSHLGLGGVALGGGDGSGGGGEDDDTVSRISDVVVKPSKVRKRQEGKVWKWGRLVVIWTQTSGSLEEKGCMALFLLPHCHGQEPTSEEGETGASFSYISL